MRRLALLPLLMFAFACNDSTLVQPENDLTIAAAQAPRTVYAFDLIDDPPHDYGESLTTPSGILHMWDYDFVYEAVGDFVGVQHVYGRATINTNTGKGNASGTQLFELTEPGVGTWECRWHSQIDGAAQHGWFYSCKGTGYFEGMKMKGESVSETGDIFASFAEIR